MKMRAKNFMKILFISVLYCFLSERPVSAYIDPQVGSYLVQIFLAGVIEVGAGVSFYWSKLISFFVGAKQQKENSGNND